MTNGRPSALGITLVVAEREKIVLAGIRDILEKEPGFQVVGQAYDGGAALHIVAEREPGVLVMGLMLGDMPGLEVARIVRRKYPKTRVVILTSQDREDLAVEALRLGVKAYILKDSEPQELIQAVRDAARGSLHLSPQLNERIIQRLVGPSSKTEQNPFASLTRRELQIALLVAQENTNGEIATLLEISKRTVEVHRENLRKKLGLLDKTQLRILAESQGYLPKKQQIFR